MLSDSAGFKEQIADARRNQILRGAARIFAEQGYHTAPIREIAQAAGVAEGTIYNYFDNKRNLLPAMVDLIAAQSLKRLITTDPPDDPREFLTMVIHNRLLLAQESGPHMAPIFAEISNDVELRELLYHQVLIPVDSHIEQHIQNYMDAGRLCQMDPAIVTRSMIGAVVVNIALKLSGIDPQYEDFPADSLIEQLTSIFLDGLLVDENNSEE
jgi:AcrR family transcriptional regulator